ncbi:DnaB-like helicase C-terminal domain-containing protein [Serratia proteamaculans]|uniref:DnaB-like helicase C-terminal domain-containing protein n=1 Tax=Serratia proteamaculans TaxID=28151 RepID=UPI003D050893
MTDNLPQAPYSVDLEQAILGSLMHNAEEDRAATVFGLVKPESFYLAAHRAIFKELRALTNANMPTDLISLSDALESKGLLEQVGGFAYLAETGRKSSVYAMTSYAMAIREKAILRYALEKLYACVELVGANNGMDAANKLANVQQMITAASDHARTGKRGGLRPAGDVIGEWVDDIGRRFDDPDGSAGLTLGIESLDRLMYPKQALRGSLVVIGARPKMGKTACYNKISTHFALNHRLPTLVFSLEMTDRGIIERMVAQEARVKSEIFYVGASDDSEMARAMAKATELAESNLMIDSTPGVTLAHIVAESRKVKRQRGVVGLVAIDYLTLMKAEAAERRDIAYGDITTGLKNLAKELDCQVVLLTQLNRKLEERADKRPVPSDSKDTGQIEQDCDVWIGLYRDAVYNKNSDPQLMEVILRLNREGASGTAYALMEDGYIKDITDEEAARRAQTGNERERRYTRQDKKIEAF